MTLDILDLLIVSHFCFNAQVPLWLWIVGVLMSISSQVSINELKKAKN